MAAAASHAHHPTHAPAHPQDFFKEAKCERFVCHFFRENWPCKVVDKHLESIAQKHMETKFARIHAEKAPFVTEKLKIWMLPTICICKDGKVIDYIVGFDELGGSDDFPESRLRMSLPRATASSGTATRRRKRHRRRRTATRRRWVTRTSGAAAIGRRQTTSPPISPTSDWDAGRRPAVARSTHSIMLTCLL